MLLFLAVCIYFYSVGSVANAIKVYRITSARARSKIPSPSYSQIYRVFIEYCVFFVILLNYASSAAALVFYLPGVCVQTLTPRENR